MPANRISRLPDFPEAQLPAWLMFSFDLLKSALRSRHAREDRSFCGCEEFKVCETLHTSGTFRRQDRPNDEAEHPTFQKC
jgi:hypothetical protein